MKIVPHAFFGSGIHFADPTLKQQSETTDTSATLCAPGPSKYLRDL